MLNLKKRNFTEIAHQKRVMFKSMLKNYAKTKTKYFNTADNFKHLLLSEKILQ